MQSTLRERISDLLSQPRLAASSSRGSVVEGCLDLPTAAPRRAALSVQGHVRVSVASTVWVAGTVQALYRRAKERTEGGGGFQPPNQDPSASHHGLAPA